MKKAIMSILMVLTVAMVGFPQEKADVEKEKAAIKQAALDYIEGWYEGNAQRMERALHPDLVKREVNTMPTGKDVLFSVSASNMVEFTRAGGGSETPKEKQKNEVIILDVYQNIATAKAISADYVDYLHLAKINRQWKIVNVLWGRKQE